MMCTFATQCARLQHGVHVCNSVCTYGCTLARVQVNWDAMQDDVSDEATDLIMQVGLSMHEYSTGLWIL
jgi:hypothetical protein